MWIINCVNRVIVRLGSTKQACHLFLFLYLFNEMHGICLDCNNSWIENAERSKLPILSFIYGFIHTARDFIFIEKFDELASFLSRLLNI